MKKLKKFFLRAGLKWLESQIGSKFDRDLSLKIDKVRAQLEEISDKHNQEIGLLVGVIKAITKKATAAALQWFQPEAILRAALWKKRIVSLLGNCRY